MPPSPLLSESSATHTYLMVGCRESVQTMQDKEPNMVLLEANRGGRSRMTVERPLIVYREPGIYTDEIYDIYGY